MEFLAAKGYLDATRPMFAAIILIFVVGYITIVLEHPLLLDKAVPAVIMGSLCWAFIAIGFHSGHLEIMDPHSHLISLATSLDANEVMMQEEGFKKTLLHHLGKTAEIMIFLIGAMTIVKIVDLHRGFEVLKTWVTIKSKTSLLWVLGILTFFLSAVIDNLTATIVVVTLLQKILASQEERIWFASLIVIAANAGGAWSPIGDVTTTMLWIGNKVTTTGLIINLVIPSIICFAVPFALASNLKPFKGPVIMPEEDESGRPNKLLSSKTMLFLGLGMIVFVPVFKTLTSLPPYIGMMLSMGVVWLVSEYIHPEEDFTEERRYLYTTQGLSRVEFSSILFFLGILMSVGALESVVYNGLGTLRYLAGSLELAVPNQDVVVMLLGAGSAIIDNVPLVAASMGMYDAVVDAKLWHFIALAAGTGGSMLIIGSAAGVAAMGIEKIDFIWYLRKITWLAAVGFIAGSAVFVWMATFLH